LPPSQAIAVYRSRTPGKAPPDFHVSLAGALYLRRRGHAFPVNRGRALRMLAAAAELEPSPTRVVVRGPSRRIGGRLTVAHSAGIGAHNSPPPLRAKCSLPGASAGQRPIANRQSRLFPANDRSSLFRWVLLREPPCPPCLRGEIQPIAVFLADDRRPKPNDLLKIVGDAALPPLLPPGKVIKSAGKVIIKMGKMITKNGKVIMA